MVLARSAFIKYQKVLCNRRLQLELRLRYLRCYIWSTLLYGVEAWTLKSTSINKLESFEMWCYRRILKIPWTDRVTNNEVLYRLGKERELLSTIKKRKVAYFGHILRNEKYEILQLIIEGKIEGRRGAGRKEISWIQNIQNWSGLTGIRELVSNARNRETFSQIVNNI